MSRVILNMFRGNIKVLVMVCDHAHYCHAQFYLGAPPKSAKYLVWVKIGHVGYQMKALYEHNHSKHVPW